MARFYYQGKYRRGFSEKLLEGSPVSDTANASQLQDRLTAGQGEAQHGGSASGITYLKRGKKKCEIAAGERSDNT